MSERHALAAILRADLASFVAKAFTTLCPGDVFLPTWHVDALAWRLQQALAGNKPRVIINLPPRSLKSLVVSVAFPAWVLGHRPESRIICVSYADELTRKFARDCRTVLEAP